MTPNVEGKASTAGATEVALLARSEGAEDARIAKYFRAIVGNCPRAFPTMLEGQIIVGTKY